MPTVLIETEVPVLAHLSHSGIDRCFLWTGPSRYSRFPPEADIFNIPIPVIQIDELESALGRPRINRPRYVEKGDTSILCGGSGVARRNRKELAITLTDDSAMAAAAIIGDSNTPKNG